MSDDPTTLPRRLRRPPVATDHRRLADAVVDDDRLTALLGGTANDAVFELVARNRLAPLLARRAAGLGLPAGLGGPLRDELLAARGRWTLLRHELARVGHALADHDIPWMPLKGADVALRVHQQPDDRVASDLDVLVAEVRFDEALDVLVRDGWRSAHPPDPRVRRFVLDEGHNWPLLRGPVALELHLRLWGRVPEGMAREILEGGEPAPDLGASARRARLEHAFAIAGVHAWMVRRPRPVATWLDLELIARAGGHDLVPRVVQATGEWGLDLPVGMAASVADALWPNPVTFEIAAALLPPTSVAERLVHRRLLARGVDAVDERMLVLAGLLAGRRTRHRWRSLWRRVLPHPGTRVLAAESRRRSRDRTGRRSPD